MREQDMEGLLASAQLRISAVRAALSRPRTCNVDECMTRCREAQGYLEWLRDSLPQYPQAARRLRNDALALTREIAQTAVLLEQAARYGRQWLARLQPPEYDAAGSRPAFSIRGSVSVTG